MFLSMGITTLQRVQRFEQLSGRTPGLKRAMPEPSAIRQEPQACTAPSALEKFPHLCSQISFLWDQKDFEVYVNRLLMDSRDGTRQGLPWDAVQELLFLLELRISKRALEASRVAGVSYRPMYEECVDGVRNASRKADPWGDPTPLREARESDRNRARAQARAKARRAVKRSWWRRLFD